MISSISILENTPKIPCWWIRVKGALIKSFFCTSPFSIKNERRSVKAAVGSRRLVVQGKVIPYSAADASHGNCSEGSLVWKVADAVPGIRGWNFLLPGRSCGKEEKETYQTKPSGLVHYNQVNNLNRQSPDRDAGTFSCRWRMLLSHCHPRW